MRCTRNHSTMTDRVEIRVACGNVLGEGPIWVAAESALYWTDIESSHLWRYDPDKDEASAIPTRDKVGSLAPERDGRLLLAYTKEIVLYDLARGTEERVARVPGDVKGVRLNDGRCDTVGRFLVGEFDYRSEGRGNCYTVDANGTLVTRFDGLSSANSTCFSPDGRIMYFADSPQRVIWAFDYDLDDGALSNRRVLHEFPSGAGLPDGSIVDSVGCIWNAEWGAARVVRYAPDGRIDTTIELPCTTPTCPAFGEGDLRTLFVTSATVGTESRGPSREDDGALYSIRVPTGGLPERVFGV